MWFTSCLQPAGPGDVYKYQKVQKTDMPSENDYACSRSQYPWGCVHTMKSLSEAFIRCNGDPQCRAIVVFPSKIKLGLFLALLLWQILRFFNTNRMNSFCRCCCNRGNFPLSAADSKEIYNKPPFKIMYSADWLEVIFKSGVEGRVTQENSAMYIKQLVANTTIADLVENVKNSE